MLRSRIRRRNYHARRHADELADGHGGVGAVDAQRAGPVRRGRHLAHQPRHERTGFDKRAAGRRGFDDERHHVCAVRRNGSFAGADVRGGRGRQRDDAAPAFRHRSEPARGAYVGADIVAGVLATGIVREDKMRVFVDVGTNGEIVLGNGQRALATAAPAGPAFEGSQIRCGMRATDGAIEGVQLGDTVELQVIGGDVRPQGICGSGLVDAVAQLLLAGLLDHSGRMKTAEDVPGHPLRERLIDVDGVRAFLLADGVYLTQKDIRELQFAKGSIATGIKVLMDILGIETKDLDEVLLGGSFGSYLNPESAKIIGLVPPVDVDRIIAVGNSAGEGAKIALLSYRERQVAYELPSRIEYIELSGRSDFNDSFISVLGFPQLERVP